MVCKIVLEISAVVGRGREKGRGKTMQQMKWIVTMCLSPVAALAFSAAICGVLIVSLTAEMHQQLWRTK